MAIGENWRYNCLGSSSIYLFHTASHIRGRHWPLHHCKPRHTIFLRIAAVAKNKMEVILTSVAESCNTSVFFFPWIMLCQHTGTQKSETHPFRSSVQSKYIRRNDHKIFRARNRNVRPSLNRVFHAVHRSEKSSSANAVRPMEKRCFQGHYQLQNLVFFMPVHPKCNVNFGRIGIDTEYSQGGTVSNMSMLNYFTYETPRKINFCDGVLHTVRVTVDPVCPRVRTIVDKHTFRYRKCFPRQFQHRVCEKNRYST